MTNKKILTLISFLLLFSFLMVGCNGGVTPPNNAPVITSVPPSLTATVGTAYTYTVTATDADDDALTYSVSPSDLAIADNVITWTPTAAGTKDVIVSVSDATVTTTQSFTITVSEPVPVPVIELTGITVLPETMTLFAGESKTITSVTATYEIRGTEVPIALGDCTYASDDELVATVGASTGVVTAVAEGSATITVSYGGQTDTLEVTVNPVLLTSIVVDPKEMDLFVRGSGTLTSVTANYDDESESELDLDACDYESDDEAVATVDDGVISALTPGTATITVTYADMTDTLEVTVSSILLTSIVVDPKDMTLFLGDDPEDIESVTAHYSDGSTKIVTSDCIYESSNENVATVDAGVVTALAYGETIITVSYTEAEITKTVSIEETDTLVVTVIDRVHNITANRYYDTIALALSDAAVNDTIEVAAGTYAQTDTPLTINVEGLTLKSIDGYATTIITATTADPCIQISAPYVTVEGFTVGGWNAINIGGVDANHAIVTGNKLSDALIWCLEGSDYSMISDNIIDGGGINFMNTPGLTDVTITGNDISNGNINMNGMGGIYTNILITGNTITESGAGYAGIDIRGTVSDFVVTHNDITDNPGGGIRIFADCTWGGADNVINSNNISGNTTFGISNEIVAATVVDATDNWWGDASGPEHSANPLGTGDVVSDNVGYVPFSTEEN